LFKNGKIKAATSLSKWKRGTFF